MRRSRSEAEDGQQGRVNTASNLCFCFLGQARELLVHLCDSKKDAAERR